jgi:hypothetical protein
LCTNEIVDTALVRTRWTYFGGRGLRWSRRGPGAVGLIGWQRGDECQEKSQEEGDDEKLHDDYRDGLGGVSMSSASAMPGERSIPVGEIDEKTRR